MKSILAIAFICTSFLPSIMALPTLETGEDIPMPQVNQQEAPVPRFSHRFKGCLRGCYIGGCTGMSAGATGGFLGGAAVTACCCGVGAIVGTPMCCIMGGAGGSIFGAHVGRKDPYGLHDAMVELRREIRGMFSDSEPVSKTMRKIEAKATEVADLIDEGRLTPDQLGKHVRQLKKMIQKNHKKLFMAELAAVEARINEFEAALGAAKSDALEAQMAESGEVVRRNDDIMPEIA